MPGGGPPSAGPAGFRLSRLSLSRPRRSRSRRPPARGAAQITIVNTDGPNEGFNDPTAATPVGGNTGTTVGQQRLIAFERAAEIWGQLLDTPVEIRVRASFDPLPCTADEGALGGAFPDNVVSDSPDAPLPGAWYPSALANKFAGTDLVPGSDDITARFNWTSGSPIVSQAGPVSRARRPARHRLLIWWPSSSTSSATVSGS